MDHCFGVEIRPIFSNSKHAVDHGAAVTNIEKDEHSLPPKAVEIGRVFGFPITNSMLVSWMAALALIIFAQLATRKMERVPSGAQNFLEWLVESLYSFLEGILARNWSKGHFGFSQRFSFSYCAPIGWVLYPALARLVGGT